MGTAWVTMMTGFKLWSSFFMRQRKLERVLARKMVEAERVGGVDLGHGDEVDRGEGLGGVRLVEMDLGGMRAGKDERCSGWWVDEHEVDAGWIPKWIRWSGGDDEWIGEDP